jgi:hypothetical protein
MTKVLRCLQASTVEPNPVDLHRAIRIRKGDLNDHEVQHLWGMMRTDGTLFMHATPWHAIYAATVSHKADILVWLLQQDFPIVVRDLKWVFEGDGGNVVQSIEREYNPMPRKVRRALLEKTVSLPVITCYR